MNVEFYIVGDREVGTKLVDLLCSAFNISYRTTLCKCEAYGQMTRINATLNPFGIKQKHEFAFSLPESKIILHRHNFGLVLEIQ